MRKIVLIVSVLFFLFTIKTDAAGGSDWNYHISCQSIAGPEKAEFEILLKNEDEKPLHFEFPTSKLFEIQVLNQGGQEVYLYSKGRHFLQAFQTVTVDPKQIYKRKVKWDYFFNRKRVPKGEYTVNVFLLPTSINNEQVKDLNHLKCSTKMVVPEENYVFRRLSIEGHGGNYLIKGETKAGEFFYTVEDGHKLLINEQKIKVRDNNKDWKLFEVQLDIPVKELPNNGSLIMNFYERGGEGKIINNYPLLLERFY
jgi:hypothetical protein